MPIKKKKKAVSIGSWTDLVEEPRAIMENEEAAVPVVNEVEAERDSVDVLGGEEISWSEFFLSVSSSVSVSVRLFDVWCQERLYDFDILFRVVCCCDS